MKYLKYLLFAILPFVFVTNVYASDDWSGYNWAQNQPDKIEVFNFVSDDGVWTFPSNFYNSTKTSAWGFNGYTTSGWSGYNLTQYSATGWSYTSYTNSINFHYSGLDFTSSNDYITIKGQLFPTNEVGADFFNRISFYMDLNYGASSTSACTTSVDKYSRAYFVNFTCSFPRTTSIILSFHFNDYVTTNQGGLFMIRSDWSDVIYSDDNTSIITGSVNNASNSIINNQNSNTNTIINNQNQNQAQTNENLNNINDSLNNDEAPDTSTAFSDIKLDSDNAVSDLVLMPITYINRILSLSKNTCASYSIDFGIFNSDYKLTFPCIKVENYLGSNLWAIIDYLICFFMIYEIILLFVSVYEDITSLRDTYEGLYEPKHEYKGYKPKHGSDD